MAEEWDVFALQPAGDYAQPEYLATLYNAYQKSIKVELNNTGSGSFAINRSSPECTETILAQGNLVRVRIPEIDDDYIFAFFLETGDFTLISSQEEGGEMLTFGGRGILSYLEYAKAAPHSYITGGDDPEAGLWRAYNAGTGSAPGQIFRRLLEEFQHEDRGVEFFGAAGSHPIPLLTIDFDYTNDSTGAPWDTTDATDEFTYQVGEDGLAIEQRLVETETIVVQMAPDFLTSAYNPANFGRDLSGVDFGAGVVRFERGVNIATELRRELAVDRVATHIFVQGEADKYGGAALSDASLRVTKEAFLQQFGTNTTTLDAMGSVDLQARLTVSDLVTFLIANRRTSDVVLVDPVSIGSSLGPVATDGFYLPGPEGTLGDFWVGDTVRVHTGAGPFDYTEVDAVVQAITISREDDNAELLVYVEAKTQPPEVLEQYGTVAQFDTNSVFVWPEGLPGSGHLLVSFGAWRGSAGAPDSTWVPWSVPAADSGALDFIAGTEYTHIHGAEIGGVGGYPTAFAYRDADGTETLCQLWEGGAVGSARPRFHFAEIAGLSGAPSATADAQSSYSGLTFTSPNIVVGAAGYIFFGFSWVVSGPTERPTHPTMSMTARSPSHDLTKGYAAPGVWGPYSIFGYRYVSAAGTYSVIVDRTAMSDGWNPGTRFGNWEMGFWAGPESPGYPA